MKIIRRIILGSVGLFLPILGIILAIVFYNILGWDAWVAVVGVVVVMSPLIYFSGIRKSEKSSILINQLNYIKKGPLLGAFFLK